MKFNQQRVGVIMGGMSAEREVSLRTGAAIVNALEERGYTVIAIDADKTLPAQLISQQIDVAFLAVHGRFGEDGTLQGMLEMMQIPYTGSGVLASALAIDKAMAKRVVAQDGVVSPAGHLIDEATDVEEFCARCHQFPQVVKPVREGSTLGIAIARSQAELADAIRDARTFDRRVLVEEFIDGREVTVSVMNQRALAIIEVVPESGFYDYSSKYTAGKTQYLVPAPLPQAQYLAIQRAAERSYVSLGCRGAARVDFMVRGDEFYFLEVNTIPGMTETSLLPKAAANCGMDFAILVEEILNDASLDR
jgi:D-alanine-D-alanine ligase